MSTISPEPLIADLETGRAEYRERVQDLVGDWLMLGGSARSSLSALQTLMVNLNGLPPSKLWRQYSHLCADGSPIELCETVTHKPYGPTITCDPGPYGAAPGERVAAAMQLARRVLVDTPQIVDLVQDICELFSARFNDKWRLWLGAEFGHARGKYKVYWSIDCQPAAETEAVFDGIFALTGDTPGEQARELFQLLGARGYTKLLSLSISGSSDPALKVYYRLPQTDFQVLRQAALTAGLAFDPFAAYVQQLLRVREGWSDPNAGLGIALTQGEVEGLALYHYTCRYFMDDAALRRQVLRCAPLFDWDVSAYRTSSQLISAGPDESLRSLVGFGLRRTGKTILHLYARTGYLASA